VPCMEKADTVKRQFTGYLVPWCHQARRHLQCSSTGMGTRSGCGCTTDLYHLGQVQEVMMTPTSDGFPEYVYTARNSDLTSRNGGWSRTGMLKYNDLYKQVTMRVNYKV
jgi:hypothetical protein